MTSNEIHRYEPYEHSFKDETSDSDICSDDEMHSFFDKTCMLLSSKKIFLDKSYILWLDATRETDFSIAAASSLSIDILKCGMSEITKSCDFPLNLDEECVGTKFSPINNNLIYVACSKANIKLFDIRTPKKPAIEFIDSTVNEAGESKTFLSFDVSPDDKLMAAGTELYDGDAFILFWEVRTASLLGAYWESHTDDVTQLKFHPQNRNTLMSASTDGLINVYNLKEASEDDALTECLNTESSVEQIVWCNHDVLCATHTHNVQMWSLNDGFPHVNFNRKDLSHAIKRKSPDYNYVPACFADNGLPVLLVGSNFKNGECVRALGVCQKQLQPLFECKQNSQRVRCAHFNEQTRILMTGGERGIIDIWKLGN